MCLGNERIPVRGDVVSVLDGRLAKSMADLTAILGAEKRPGDVVRLAVVRDGSPLAAEVEVGDRPETGARSSQ